MSDLVADIAPSLLNTITYILQQQQGGQDGHHPPMGGGGRGGPPKTPTMSYSSGICPDEQCQMKLYYPTHEASVECPGCGQRHNIADIRDSVVLKEKENKVELSIREVRQAFSSKKKAPELVQVRGISNYQCKLLSPLLTTHGRDKDTDTAKPLTELGMGSTFDCSKFAMRAFSIEEGQLETAGYGRDRSGSVRYLKETLQQLQTANANKTRLVPLHADGDGHCLVHAISRCLVGRELFWHALRQGLHDHLRKNLTHYRAMFKEFYEEEEWEKIIAEAAPDYQPQAGEVHGLRNIHIFGLANVLRRPIVLLDSLSGIKSSGDYSGLFLPAIHPPSDCSSVDSTTGSSSPHSPIVVAWSNSGRNHFVPLVPIRGQPLPKLPPSLCPTVWGVDEDLFKQYVKVDSNSAVEICGGKLLSDGYLQKLVKCMETLFFERNGVHLSIVADVHQSVFRRSGYVGIKPEFVVETAKMAIEQERLFRCLICNLLTCVPFQWLEKGGLLYGKAESTHQLGDGLMYEFPMEGVIATYSSETDTFCPMERESDPERNTNAYDVAQKVINDHFPGEFGSERLVQQIVDSIMRATEKSLEQVMGHHPPTPDEEKTNPFDKEEAQKRVMTGPKSQTFHREELGVSSAERRVRARVEENARVQQRKRSAMTEREGERETERRAEGKRVQSSRRSPVPQKSPVHPTPSSSIPTASTTLPTVTPSHSHSSSSPPASKKIKVTSSDGRTANLTLDPSTTFVELQAAIERELRIPAEQQRLRRGFPPRELRPSEDPTHPVELTNGERVSVDVVTTSVPSGGGEKDGGGVKSEEVKEKEVEDEDDVRVKRKEQELESAQQALDHIIQQLQEVAGSEFAEFNLWSIAQYQPHFFAKGGDYYKQVLRAYGGNVPDNTHFQFREFPGKTFAFNKKESRLEVCLGRRHVPVGPLSPEEEQLAQEASGGGTTEDQKEDDSTTTHRAGAGGAAPQTMGLSGAVSSRSETAAAAVRAFSGRGQALGSRQDHESSNS